MGRFLAGVASALLLVTAGFFVWSAQADRASLIPPAPAAAADAPMGIADVAGPPAATEKTREEKRFARYDKDKNGTVGRDEYLLSRKKAFAKLDVNRNGRLEFDEYAVKTTTKFAGADRDRNGALTAAEFATTRVVRKNRPKPDCAPALTRPAEDEAEG